MERIASFCVDHTRLDRGMYLSRQDGDVLTWDIRMKKPNQGDYLSTGAAHTLEHLFATYARNSQYKDGVIYVGPMGCRTGFYLLTRGLTPAEALSLTVESFRFMAAFEGAVPGASEVECGNYRDMDLPAARAEAAAMLPLLEALTADELHHFVVPDGCILGGHLHLMIPHGILSFPLVRSFLFLVQSQRPRGLSSIPSYQIRKAKHVRVWEDSKKHKGPGCFHSGPLCHFYFEE